MNLRVAKSLPSADKRQPATSNRTKRNRLILTGSVAISVGLLAACGSSAEQDVVRQAGAASSRASLKGELPFSVGFRNETARTCTATDPAIPIESITIEPGGGTAYKSSSYQDVETWLGGVWGACTGNPKKGSPFFNFSYSAIDANIGTSSGPRVMHWALGSFFVDETRTVELYDGELKMSVYVRKQDAKFMGNASMVTDIKIWDGTNRALIEAAGKCIDIADGRRVERHGCHGAENQRFLKSGPVGEPSTIQALGKCVDVNEGNRQLELHGCHGDYNQQFSMVRFPLGPYKESSTARLLVVGKTGNECVRVSKDDQSRLELVSWETCKRDMTKADAARYVFRYHEKPAATQWDQFKP